MFGFSNDLAERLAEERPVVVMGRGHSGTRIMAWALEALGLSMGTLKNKATGDAQDRRFTGCIKKIASQNVGCPPLAEPVPREVARLLKRTWRFMEWVGDRSGGWGWKFPETYIIGNVVEAVFPRALYIHMVRDGRDLAFKAHLTDDEHRGLGREILKHLDMLGKPHYIQAAGSWDFQVRRFGEVEKRLGERVHRLTFEALCANPLHEMERICGFLGKPMTEECRTYLSANICQGKVAQYRGEDPSLVAEVEKAIGPTLVEWGYPLEHS